MANKEKKAAEQTAKFKKAELIENALAVFNVQPEIVAGALYGKEEATKTEAEEAIKAFLEKPKKATTEAKEEKGAAE